MSTRARAGAFGVDPTWDEEGERAVEQAKKVRWMAERFDGDVRAKPHPSASWMAAWGKFLASMPSWVKSIEAQVAADAVAHGFGGPRHGTEVMDAVRRDIADKTEALERRREEWAAAVPAEDPLPELTPMNVVDIKIGPLTISPRAWPRERLVRWGVGLTAGTALVVVGFRWWKGRHRA